MTQTAQKPDLDQFRNIVFTSRTRCVICGFPMESALIDLPRFPVTEIYVPEKITGDLGFVDQKFHFCLHCGHGQLANLIDKNVLYGQCYRTRTSISPSAMGAVDVFAEFIEQILEGRKIGTLLEIGCNDLYFLHKFKDRTDALYGIDPILKGREQDSSDSKIKLIGDFFEHIDLKAAGIKPDIVLSSHTFEHIEKPAELIEKTVQSAAADALFFFQFPGLEALVADARFDQMFHQHLNYFSAASVAYLLEKLGCRLIGLKVNPFHWGALMVAFCKKDALFEGRPGISTEKLTARQITSQYQVFKDCMTNAARRVEAVREGPLYGFGAAMMLPVLDYYIPGLRKLECILDDDQNKRNLYYLNYPVQIRTPQNPFDFYGATVVLTAIYSLTTQRAILKRLIDLKVKQIILPLNII